jgi:hypothetical protein
MEESNAAWMWSEAFVEALENAMLDPPWIRPSGWTVLGFAYG